MTEWALLCDGQEYRLDVEAGTVAPSEFERATRWRVDERGLCRGDLCVPTQTAEICSGERVDLAAAARVLRRPFVTDPTVNVAALGEAAADRTAALASLQAPEFALPDLTGDVHRLSDYRGRKVLLAAYASW